MQNGKFDKKSAKAGTIQNKEIFSKKSFATDVKGSSVQINACERLVSSESSVCDKFGVKGRTKEQKKQNSHPTEILGNLHLGKFLMRNI